jgi:hypothetical protein
MYFYSVFSHFLELLPLFISMSRNGNVHAGKEYKGKVMSVLEEVKVFSKLDGE